MGRTKSIVRELKEDSVLEIKKHSSLVQMWNIATLLERKSMNALIWIAKDQLKRNEDAKIFYCKLGLVKRLAGMKDSSNLGLKKALVSLSHTNFEYNVLNKDKNKRGVFSFLAEASITEQGRWKETIVSFEFPSTVLNVIKHPAIYVKLNMYILMGLESKHSIALYEHVKDYEKIQALRCPIDHFKAVMGLKPNQYEIFTMLKKRVLDTAVKEINDKTDVQLSYELEREWRKVVAILFKFSQSVSMKNITKGEQELIKRKLKSFELIEGAIEKLIEHHNAQYLLANIAVVEKQMRKWSVKNPVGYLLKAIENDYRPNSPEVPEPFGLSESVEDQESQEAKKQKEQEAALRKQKEEEIQMQYSDLPESDQSRLKEEFLEWIESHNFFSKLLESKGREYVVIQIQRYKYLESELASEVA